MKSPPKTRLFAAICAVVLFPLVPRAATPPEEVLLWPGVAPGSEGKAEEEAVRVTDAGEHVITKVHKPSLTLYLPEREKATGAAVIIAPGGGHRELWMDHEGHNGAKWLRERGIAAFVLKYRLGSRDSGYQWDVHGFADMQRAIRLVRSRSEEWGVRPDRVGALGFSAGGELVARAATRFDNGNESAADPVEKQSSKLAFQALIYPGKSGLIAPSEGAPPVFIVCGFNDRPDISRGMAEVYLKFKEARVPAELHIYSEAGHGFGVREKNGGAVSRWPARFEEWLADRKLLQK